MKKQWEGQYLEDAFDDEIRLAKMHPKWRRTYKAPAMLTFDAQLELAQGAVHHFGSASSPRLSFSTQAHQAPPRWRRDWRAAGPLATELGLSVRHDADEGVVSVGVGSGRRNVSEAYADHPDRDAAAMAAIVRAAIRFLIEAREA